MLVGTVSGKRSAAGRSKFFDIRGRLSAPNLLEKFNVFGYTFTKTSFDVEIRRPDNGMLAEIGLLLENGEYAVVVEVKARLKTEDIQEHVKRVEKVRRHADERNDRRIYIGALAGAIVEDNVRDYAVKTGFCDKTGRGYSTDRRT
jgi:hypothetical protein